EAEVAVLPRLYEATDQRDVTDTVRRAEARGLRTLVFSGHDLEPVMASGSVILLHEGPTRGGQAHADVLAVPYVFTDRARWPEARADGSRPTVAFCGQGASRMHVAPVSAVRRWFGLVADRSVRRVVAPPAGGHVRLRSAALAALSLHPGIDDRFVVRDQYRAGVSSDADRARTQAEFDDNLRSATYALCVRGTGNFSARFYESLSFGRVPLFVDTNCVLPFEDEIDWRSRTVWLDHTEVDSIGDRLMSAHPEVLVDPERSPDSLRRLWEERLTEQGFYDHLPALVRRLL
ncbi:MAG TPA: exostosin family protein, partial [Acidimicrobiales bacterium]|nr:exostosin family protein [Acidimicrobiales bacterium]